MEEYKKILSDFGESFIKTLTALDSHYLKKIEDLEKKIEAEERQIAEKERQIKEANAELAKTKESLATFKQGFSDKSEELQQCQKLLEEKNAVIQSHIQDKTIHKKPLTDESRQKSLANRQRSAEDRQINILKTIEAYLWRKYQPTFTKYNQTGQLTPAEVDSIKVDMAYIMTTAGVQSTKTVRETVDAYSKHNIFFPDKTFSHRSLDFWVRYKYLAKKQAFCNIPKNK